MATHASDPGAIDPPVGASGTGWEDRPETPEERLVLVERTGEQQRRVSKSLNAGLNGQIDRGQHQKQLFAARGTLHVFDRIPLAVNKGVFAAPFSRPVACRFSNGQPCSFSDRKADVRGVALKFFTPEGIEADLLMTNEGGRSHARNAKQFVDFADILVAKIEDGTLGAIGTTGSELLARRLRLVEAARIFAILSKETIFRSVESLATERYWGSVVALDDVALKYSLHPHDTTQPGTDGDAQADDYLRQDLRNRLRKGPIKWRLCVQLFADEKQTPINDASISWTVSPVTIGELEIAAEPSDTDEQFINQMAFNPSNGFTPLGITHARQQAYAVSARNRTARGLVSSDGARQFLESPTVF